MNKEGRRIAWFRAYEELPPIVRQIVADAPYNYDPQTVCQLWCDLLSDGSTTERALEKLRSVMWKGKTNDQP